MIRLRNEGLEGFEFTLEQRTDVKMAMAVLAGSGLSLTQAAKIAMEFHERRISFAGMASEHRLDNFKGEHRAPH
jgi:hypothetical protein